MLALRHSSKLWRRPILRTNGQHSAFFRNSVSFQSLRFSTTATEDEKKKPSGLVDKLWGPDSNIASPNFNNRWAMVIPAFFAHMCIGSPYAWSMMGDQITREMGFVASSSADWSLMQAALPLSIVFGFHGCVASLAGKWQMKVGARKALACAAGLFGGGLLLGAAGIHYHCLPLLYGGYGIMAGGGIGISYTPPIQTLFNWFPDKKGLVSGLVVAGFGSGALVFTPVVTALTKVFAKMPEYLGKAEDFTTSVVDGKLMAMVNGNLVEVVSAGAKELAKIPSSYNLTEGLYVVGTGSTGAAEALGVCGLTYFSIMLAASLLIKSPHPSNQMVAAATVAANEALAKKQAALKPPTAADAPAATPQTSLPHNVSVDDAMKLPQFHLLSLNFFCLSAGGMGLFSVAKPMMSEVFSAAMPTVVTAAFASTFVLMLSSGNLGGRIGWAAVSDVIGSRNTFYILTMGSVPLYLAMPTLVDSVITTQSTLPLYLFCAGTTLAVSGMGGGFSVMPAYEADLFGTKYVGAIHGRMLLGMAAAAIGGPLMLLKLRGIAEKEAVLDLITKISPEKFEKAFGAPMDQVSDLLAAKIVSINKLMALCPPGVVDPTPHLYDSTMYTLGGLMTLSAIAHYMVRPMSETQMDKYSESRKAKVVIDVSSPKEKLQ